MNASLIEVAAKIIKENRYLTLATCQNGTPWAAPVAYTVEPDFAFVFYTALEAKHTRHLIDNPIVGGAIYNSTLSSNLAIGVQFQGHCTEVPAEQLKPLMERYFRLSFPDLEDRAQWNRPVEDFVGEAPQRFFRIRLQEIGTGDPLSAKIDRRVALDIQQVQKAYLRLL